MPVTIWSNSKVSDALPKTYHHPIGPAAALEWMRIIGKVFRTQGASNQPSNAYNIGGRFFPEPRRFLMYPLNSRQM